MYRFRSVDNLLTLHHELKNDEIYFSDIASLNDPIIERYRIVQLNLLSNLLIVCV